jgi:hypothetical protein
VYVQLSHTSQPKEPDTVTILELSNQCNLHKETCTANFSADSSFTIKVDPHPIDTARKQTVILTTHKTDLTPLAIDLNVTDMDMGYNRPNFHLVSEGVYTLTFVLPVCVSDSMYWRALVIFQKPDQTKIGVPFYFLVKKYGKK